MLSTDELAQLRALQEENMPETVVVHRKVLTKSTTTPGSHSEVDQVVTTTKGRIELTGRSPEERLIADRVTGKTVSTIVMPVGTDVKEADELVIGPRTFQVVGIPPRSYETARRAVCTERT